MILLLFSENNGDAGSQDRPIQPTVKRKSGSLKRAVLGMTSLTGRRRGRRSRGYRDDILRQRRRGLPQGADEPPLREEPLRRGIFNNNQRDGEWSGRNCRERGGKRRLPAEQSERIFSRSSSAGHGGGRCEGRECGLSIIQPVSFILTNLRGLQRNACTRLALMTCQANLISIPVREISPAIGSVCLRAGRVGIQVP